jgi:hypothetical protein
MLRPQANLANVRLASISHSAAGADLRARRLDADNHDLAARAEAAEVEVRRLRFEEAIVPVKAQVAQIVYNRENVGARIETALGSEEDAEASEALSREARLEEDAKRLRRVLAILRKAGKASPAPILLQDLLNGQERDIYPAALTWTERQGLRLHAQASMGEFLVAAEGGLRGWVFSAFNARRVGSIGEPAGQMGGVEQNQARRCGVKAQYGHCGPGLRTPSAMVTPSAASPPRRVRVMTISAPSNRALSRPIRSRSSRRARTSAWAAARPTAFR